jgi:predicted subunit of tRNA(5-methylaminomethyl-2-thiouridylate) methyltransferase
MVKVIIRVYTVCELSTMHHTHMAMCDSEIPYFHGWALEEVAKRGEIAEWKMVEDGNRSSDSRGRTQRSAHTRILS